MFEWTDDNVFLLFFISGSVGAGIFVTAIYFIIRCIVHSKPFSSDINLEIT
jgi:hypothetical protein